MCHPSLTVGMCCICYGTLTPDNTLYEDLHQGRGGVHRGKCAILAGIYPDSAAQFTCEALIKKMHAAPSPRSPEWNAAYRQYGAYIDRIITEDHYDMSGPERPH